MVSGSNGKVAAAAMRRGGGGGGRGRLNEGKEGRAADSSALSSRAGTRALEKYWTDGRSGKRFGTGRGGRDLTGEAEAGSAAGKFPENNVPNQIHLRSLLSVPL